MKTLRVSLKFNLILTVLLIGFFSTSTSHAQSLITEPQNYVQVRAITSEVDVKGGETVRIGIEQTIYPEWHTYWKNPGDSGTPMTVEWIVPPGFTFSELEWPIAEKIPYGDLTNYGYEGQVVILQNLTLPNNIGSTPFALNGKVNLLVCKDICIPETHDIMLIFNGSAAAEALKISKAEEQLPLDVSWDSEFYSDKENFFIHTTLEDTSLLEGAKDFALLPEDWGTVDNNADVDFEITKNGFTLTQKLGERQLSEITELPHVLSYKNIAGDDKAIRVTAKPNPKAIGSNSAKGGFDFIAAVVFAVLGGIILNLMPCVFPILSMKALSLVNLKDKDEEKARLYGLSYTAGILITFGLIGAILLALKASGAQIGWGFQLQNPIVITALTYLIFIIGLNLAGLFEFSAKLGKLGDKIQTLSGKKGHSGAFFTGVLATLVATPCTAPFMGAALGYALTQNPVVSMIVFLALGLGLALPYLALCYIPALRSKLPKPGAWMETFKQFLAFPMFLTAAWLVWVLSQQAGALSTLMVLSALVFITLIFWVAKRLPEKGLGRKLGLGLMIFSSLFVLYALCTPKMEIEGSPNVTSTEFANWSEFSSSKLDELLKGNKAVFTNMTAAWCITCKVNERIALKTETIRNLFANKNIEYLKGDWTNQDADITAYLNKFERQGVPLYVYYGPRDTQTGKRPEPVILPQILTAGLVKRAISEE